ncbi:MAG: hypothetical protein ACYC5M_11245 [Anaerolineae bacterium]
MSAIPRGLSYTGLVLALVLVISGCRGPVTVTPVPEAQRTPIEVPTEAPPEMATAVATEEAEETATPEQATPEALTPTPAEDATTTPEVTPEVSAEVLEAVLATHADAVEGEDQTVGESLVAVEWPDGCLGVYQVDQFCTQAITPGFRVVLDAEERAYQYHTNEDGSVVMPVPGPVPPDGGLALTWEENGACYAAILGEQETVTHGPCEQPDMTTPLTDTQLLQDLADLSARHVPFSAETEVGNLYLAGQGTQIPSPQEREDLAARVRALVAEQVGEGEDSPTLQPVLTWRREAEGSDVCHELLVYADGAVQANSCAGGQVEALGAGQLTAFEVQRLVVWQANLESFDEEQESQDKEDATVRIVFTGAGTESPSESDVRLMANLGQRVLSRLVDW